MRLNLAPLAVFTAATAATLSSAAPFDAAQQQPIDVHRLGDSLLAGSATSSLLAWTSSAIDTVRAAFTPSYVSSTAPADVADKTIWQIINEDDSFSQLAHVLNYSSQATKDLLDGGEEGLTLLAPQNWHKDHRSSLLPSTDDHPIDIRSATAHWANLERLIDDAEGTEAGLKGDDSDDDSDERRRRRRRFLTHIIDATLRYHLVLSPVDGEPVDSSRIVRNSSVATRLHVTSRAEKYVGKLNDGQPFRVRTGKSLLPTPSVYFNFYSKLIKPDVKAKGNALIHVVQYPLLIPPSALQTLFYGQTSFSTLTSALQKVHAAQYLSVPFRHPSNHSLDQHAFGEPASHHHGDPHDHHTGSTALTLFAPTNHAWGKLPWAFRAYLFSPWGERLLAKILMLHALPFDIFFADAVHHVERKGKSLAPVEGKTEEVEASSIWDWLPSNGEPQQRPFGKANVTTYEFETALPKLNRTGCGHHGGHHFTDLSSHTEHEKVIVKVYRYYLLPGNRGPLQTRVTVQDVAVLFQDIPVANGAIQLIERFIRPQGHPDKGVWGEVAAEAERFGFGVATEEELASREW